MDWIMYKSNKKISLFDFQIKKEFSLKGLKESLRILEISYGQQ